jgi:transcriptional regulator with XRE-family HTH domain
MMGRLQQVVGENLRSHRQKLGLSQEAFAEVLGVHRTYMGAVERGEQNLTLQSVERIAETIRVSPYELLRESTRRR